jgi:hypothetical protein
MHGGEKIQSEGVTMETINVEGLPEPVARALEALVQAVREQLAKDQKKAPSGLPV